MNKKIRIRDKKELEDRKNSFLEICNILDELNVRYFIQGGTLLGAKRDKRFIEWDWDVEISLFNEDLNNNFEKIIFHLIKNNFEIFSCRKTKLDSKIDVYKNYSIDVTGYTLFGWTHDKNNKQYFRNKISFPDFFLEKFGTIEFYGKKFNTPNPIEDYLTFQYGDWKIRKRTDEKSYYMTSKFYKRDNFFLRSLKKIFNIIKNF